MDRKTELVKYIVAHSEGLIRKHKKKAPAFMRGDEFLFN